MSAAGKVGSEALDDNITLRDMLTYAPDDPFFRVCVSLWVL